MWQDSNKQNRDKNLKLMMLSGTVLIVLFFYTIYKSSSHLQNSTYSFGLIFLFVLFVLAILARVYKKKIVKFLNKNKLKDSPFAKELEKSNESSSTIKESTNTNNDDSDVIEVIKPTTTFKDIAGISDVKVELEEIVEFLHNPKKYYDKGVKLPKGVLLYGPPGVGKTLMAKAVAGEADVPFFYQSGASFVQIYVGMGAKRVRELFAKAKSNAPSIIFIDEIDAIGKSRGTSTNDERESTLNELLTQMDGFEGENGVIVIAATNKIDVLDEALLRAGRFDRRVHIGLPNINDRKEILKLYLKGIKNSLDIESLAKELSGFSSASISTLINEAMLNMIKNGEEILSSEYINIAKEKLEFGKKEKFVLNENEKEILSIYQASKFFITKKETSLFDENSKNINSLFPSKHDLKEQLKKYLAGSVGLEILKDEKYAIFPQDLKMAKELALDMSENYDMSKSADELIDQVKVELKKLFDENYDELLSLSNKMAQKEYLSSDDI